MRLQNFPSKKPSKQDWWPRGTEPLGWLADNWEGQTSVSHWHLRPDVPLTQRSLQEGPAAEWRRQEGRGGSGGRGRRARAQGILPAPEKQVGCSLHWKRSRYEAGDGNGRVQGTPGGRAGCQRGDRPRLRRPRPHPSRVPPPAARERARAHARSCPCPPAKPRLRPPGRGTSGRSD